MEIRILQNRSKEVPENRVICSLEISRVYIRK